MSSGSIVAGAGLTPDDIAMGDLLVKNLLDIIQARKTTGVSNGGIKKMAICRRVHLHDKVRKEDVHAETVHANETTTPLALMSPKTV